MTYKDKLTEAMQMLAQNPKTMFLGYNVRYGSMANGTLKGINPEQLYEMPVAENVVVGTAIGLALAGYCPVVYIERMDFILNAMDAIVNHMDKLPEISHGVYKPKVIIRTCIGGKERPLFTGATHTADLCPALDRMLKETRVIPLHHADMIEAAYEEAKREAYPIILAEYRDLYDTTL